jgi:hypothetical protein
MLGESEGILCLAEQLLVSQEGLCSMKLAVNSGFEKCNGEILQNSYNIIRFFGKLFLFLVMTKDMLIRNCMVVLQGRADLVKGEAGLCSGRSATSSADTHKGVSINVEVTDMDKSRGDVCGKS